MDELYLYSLIQDVKHNKVLTSADLNPLEEGVKFDTTSYEVILKEAKLLATSGIQSDNIFLESIFPNLSSRKSAEKMWFSHSPLSLDEDFFPNGQPQENANLVNSFSEEIKGLRGSSILSKTETFLYLLQKYGAGLPSQYGSDVSFYDYTKVKAGIACCLYKGNEDLLLIGGGVSGIQNYLYDIIKRRASKTLKGRSFFIQLVVDQVVQYILQELSLYQCNILYASGGNFYLIAPGSAEVKLKKIDKKVSKHLFEVFKANFTFELDGVLMKKKDILENPGQFWAELGKKNQIKKQQPFHTLMLETTEVLDNKNGFNLFFNNSDKGGEALRDAITNEEIGTAQWGYLDKEEDTRILKPTAQQIGLGTELRGAGFIGIPNQFSEKNYDPLKLGITYNLNVEEGSFKQLLSFNELTFLQTHQPRQITGFKFYGGNQSPVFKNGDIDSEGKTREEGEPKTFEDLAEGTKGFKRLGFLRMDVDGLGKTISDTFNSSGNSLARFSTFSRSIDYFFKGYLNTLWSNNELYKSHIQIIYAGGDDLFMVGRWDVIINFAKEIRNHFQKWVGTGSPLSLSGGVVLVGPKFPISKAAILAGDAEDAAKAFSLMVKGEEEPKNAFTLFGVSLNWEYEFPIVERLKDLLVLYLEKSLPKSVLMNIQSFHAQKAYQEEHGLAQSWRWRAAYSFTRAGTRIKRRDEHIAEWLKEQSEKIMFNKTNQQNDIESKNEYFDLLNVAARWAELVSRK